jgi:hypothetical protein
MDKNLWQWLIGVIVLVIAFVLIASAVHYAAPSSQTATTTPASTSTAGSAGGTGSPAGSGPGNIGGITNPGAPTSSVPYQTGLMQLGTTYPIDTVKVTPLSVTEDSRCPQGVQCIQAGTVKVSVKIAYGIYSTTQTFTLGVPQSAYGYTAELKSVQPAKQQGTVIKSSDYRFVFVVSKP